MDEKTFSRYFKAFRDPTRRRILQLLSRREMTVNQIVKAVGLSQPTVSRHLAMLRDAGVAVDRRDGQKVFYSLNKKAVANCCVCFCDDLKIGGPAPKGRKKR
jgi:DNA-binding transcriptional ArsR family regulator